MLLAESLLGSSSTAANYIEDVFSTYLYAGNGSTQTITNGIDLSTKGGLVWSKSRVSSVDHALYDTARGNKFLSSNTTSAQSNPSISGMSFTTTGYNLLGADGNLNNTSFSPYVSWTFRKQAKFFDVVTYTGNGTNRTIAHNLGSVPGCIIVKRTDTTADWQVYHRSLANTEYLVLNTNAAKATGTTRWNSTTPTSTVFSLGTDTTVNANGGTYVAYLFAHDAGGFGAAGTDNVISCGSYTGNGATIGNLVNLGFEPQFLLIKGSITPDNTQDWRVVDNMRGIPMSDLDMLLAPNTSAAETDSITCNLAATGFNPTGPNYNASGSTYIYIAIRRGPMRTPTTGTSVFNPVVYTGTNVDNRLVDTNIAPDMVMVRQRNDTVLGGMVVGDRLRGQPYMLTGTTGAEVNDANSFDAQIVSGTEYGTAFSSMNGFWCGNDATSKLNASTVASNQVAEAFKRAPAFFDQVCYTGTGAAISLTHNLGVPPEMAIVKYRGFNTATNSRWDVGHKDLSTVKPSLILNTAASAGASLFWDPDWSSAATSTSLTLSSNQSLSAFNYVAYLFATCPGVSKVGSYTGNAAQTAINCGFTSSARFVLIKRYDADGDWYVWDSARGIIDSNDPYLRLNSTGAEVTTTDFVDTTTTGFEITAAASATVNINAANYIYLAIS